MSLDLFLAKPDASAIATFADFHKILRDAFPDTTVSEKVVRVITDGEHQADIYCFDNEQDPDVVQWINVNGFDFNDLAEFLVSTFGLEESDSPGAKRGGKTAARKAAKKSIKTLDGGASALPNSKWNESWRDHVGSPRLEMGDGSIALPISTNVGDFFGFMYATGQPFWICFSPERDLYFIVWIREFTPAHVEAILPREELRLSEYIEAARKAIRREIESKMTGARFAGLELQYGDESDEPLYVSVVFNVTHDMAPGHTTHDCFRVALPKQSGGETEFDYGYVPL